MSKAWPSVAKLGPALPGGARQGNARSVTDRDETDVTRSPAQEAGWLALLRAACSASSQTSVARKVGYSGAVISQVLSGSYAGDLQRVQAAVEGAFMGVEVCCPVLGLISRAKCVEIQRRAFTPTNPANVALYRACRSGCVHSFLPQTVFPAPSVQPAVMHNTGSRGAVHATVLPIAISHSVTPPTGRRKRPTHSKSRQGDNA